MSWLRNQVDDLKYLVSKDNTTSRGFYLFFTIVATVLVIATLVTFVMASLGVMQGFLRIVGFLAFPVIVAGILLIMHLLSR